MASSDWTESLVFLYGNQKHRWEWNFWTYITFLVSLASDWKTTSIDCTACMVVSFLKKNMVCHQARLELTKLTYIWSNDFLQFTVILLDYMLLIVLMWFWLHLHPRLIVLRSSGTFCLMWAGWLWLQCFAHCTWSLRFRCSVSADGTWV